MTDEWAWLLFAALEGSLRWLPVLVSALILAGILRRRLAVERSAVWAAALFALPLLTLIGGRLPLAAPDLREPLAAAVREIDLAGGSQQDARKAQPTADAVLADRDARSAPPAAREDALRERPSSVGNGSASLLIAHSQVLALLWAAIVGVLLTCELASLVGMRVLVGGARPINTSELPAAVRGRGDHPKVLQGRTAVPLLLGVFRPRIVLPADWYMWPDEWVRAAILHESAHARRRDLLVLTAARLVRAVFWFNPGVWIAYRQLKIESEAATDEQVLRAGLHPLDYADALLGIARQLGGDRLPLSGIAMAGPRGLHARLLRVANVTPQRLAFSARTYQVSAPVAVVCLLAAIPAANTVAAPWLERHAVEDGGVLWQVNCPTGVDQACQDRGAEAVRLLRNQPAGGVAAVQHIASGKILVYTFLDLSGSMPAVPAVPMGEIAALPLAAAWWEAGLEDRSLPCPAVINLERAGPFANRNGLDTGLIRAPEEVVSMRCATGAIAMAWYLARDRGEGYLLQSMATWGFAPNGDSFWRQQRFPMPAAPQLAPHPAGVRITEILAGSAHGSVRTTPLHIIRFLQAVASGGRMTDPTPPAEAAVPRFTTVMRPETAARLLETLSSVAGDSSAPMLAGLLGAGRPSEADRHDELFAGFVLDSKGDPEYGIAVWLPAIAEAGAALRLARELLDSTL